MLLRRIALAIAGLLVALFALYLLAAWVAVPWLAPARVEAALEDALGVEATLEGVRFAPFALELRVVGLRLDADHGTAASLEEGVVDLAFRPLLSSVVLVERIALRAPDVLVYVSEDGSLSVAGIAITGDDVGEAVPAPPPDAGEGGEGESEDAAEAADGDGGASDADADDEGSGDVWEVRLADVEIAQGSIRIEDHSRQPIAEYAAKPLDVRVSDLDLTGLLGSAAEAGNESEVSLSVSLQPASLALSGQLDLSPLLVDLEIGLKDFDLSRLQPYVARDTRLEIVGGSLTVESHLVLSSSEEGALVVTATADVGIQGLEVRRAGEDEPLVAWSELKVSGIHFAGDPPSLGIERIALESPRADLAVEDSGELNLVAALAPEESAEPGPAPAAGEAAEEGPPLAVEIGPIHVGRGHVRFTDRRSQPPYRVAVEELEVDVDRFTTNAADRSQVRLSGKVDGYASLAVNGSLTPLDPKRFLDITGSLVELEMSPFTPYAGRYVGNEIDAGRASLSVHASVEQGLVHGDNELVVRDLDFGKSVKGSGEATRLPVPAAAALLADRNGEIRVQLPVDGNLDDPDFSYAGTMLRTLQSLILRVVGTPLAVVGGMVSLGGKLIPVNELGAVPFEPGIHELSPGAVQKLRDLAEVIEDKEGIELEIRGAANASLDDHAPDLQVLARRRAETIQRLLVEAGFPEGQIRIGSSRVDRGPAPKEGVVESRIELR